MLEDGLELASKDALIEDIVADKIVLDMLMAELDALAENERCLINALFFEGLSERDYSKVSGIPQKTITSIAITAALCLTGKIRKVLVAAPLSIDALVHRVLPVGGDGFGQFCILPL